MKDTPPGELVRAIHAVAAGDTMLSGTASRTVVDHIRRGRPEPSNRADDRLATLTERELEVAVAVAQGLSNAEVAESLHMSVPTVKAHVTKVFAKLGTVNRVQVAICVHDAGLV